MPCRSRAIGKNARPRASHAAAWGALGADIFARIPRAAMTFCVHAKNLQTPANLSILSTGLPAYSDSGNSQTFINIQKCLNTVTVSGEAWNGQNLPPHTAAGKF